MKARHISISFASVYALGLLDQVRLIRRGPDGFWGPWQATGVNAKRLVHAGTVTALIGLDDRVAIYERLPGRVQHSWDFQASELASWRFRAGAARCSRCRPGRYGTHRSRRCSPSGALGSHWGAPPIGWPRLPSREGGPLSAAVHAGAIAYAQPGRPELRVELVGSSWSPGGGADDLALSMLNRGGWRCRPGAGRSRIPPLAGSSGSRWHDWESFGGLARSLSVARTSAGGLALFVTGPDGRSAPGIRPSPSRGSRRPPARAAATRSTGFPGRAHQAWRISSSLPSTNASSPSV